MGGSACWPMLLLHLHKHEAWPADNLTEEEVAEAEGPTPRAAGGERALPEQRLWRVVTQSAGGTDTIHSPQGYPVPHCNTCTVEGKRAISGLFIAFPDGAEHFLPIPAGEHGLAQGGTECKCLHCLTPGHQQSHFSWCQLSQCHDRLCLANPAPEWGEGVSALPTPGEQLLPGH